MSDGIKYRPKRYIQYSFSNWNCIISCYPQQHWVKVSKSEIIEQIKEDKGK